MECEQSSISTVAQEDWYSHWWTCKSEYSMFSGNVQALALDCARKRCRDVEVERVAKLVLP